MTVPIQGSGNLVDPKNEKRLNDSRQFWDHEAASFDDDPDHGLKDPHVLKVWTDLLKAWLPAQPARILDVGCGTGSISVVLAGFGHQVVGIDLSPAMIALARAKAVKNGLPIEFQVMDAAESRFQPSSFDGIVCRHLLWALPTPRLVLQRWVELLKPHGRLILIEGYWGAEAGLHADEITAALPSSVTVVAIDDLSHQPDFWGKPVSDERYAIIADLIGR